jgi:hypothetical protein
MNMKNTGKEISLKTGTATMLKEGVGYENEDKNKNHC